MLEFNCINCVYSHSMKFY
uniref:Uncharacterized protein n=1 Tax=Arundo donax TaxID=35708 RepID=A0A0A8YT31_ARUDO